MFLFLFCSVLFATTQSRLFRGHKSPIKTRNNQSVTPHYTTALQKGNENPRRISDGSFVFDFFFLPTSESAMMRTLLF